MISRQYADIEPEQLSTRQTDTLVVDVREASEFEGALGHIPGAWLAPLSELRSHAARWPKQTPIVLVCRSGRRSAEAAGLLVELGFEQVFNLRGGMQAYRTAGLPTECTPCRR